MQNTRVKLIVHNRKLLGQFDGATVEFSPEALLARTEPLAILGEAGIGKSELLTALSGSEDCKLVSAARLAGSRDPRALVGLARLVLIDGLDEAAGAKDGEAVDKVLSALDAAGSPRFILACRVADWRSATATQRIADIYGTSPLELHLTPLTRDQIHEVLTVAVGGERATEIVDHFETRRLSELLGNPQTLDMITSLPGQIALPESSLDLFEQYVGLTWHEHSAMKPDTPLRKAGREKVLDALGAAFAAQILTGTSALSRRPPDPNGEDDLSLADVAALPGAEPIEDFLDSRLVLTLSVDRFTYLHRRIGEYLGARWLAGHADTRRKRKRLLAMLREQDIVPANLRGLHAWLAMDQELAVDVIAADPMGVIEYGDTDNLSVQQAGTFIGALCRLAERNPRFRGWESYRFRGIAKPELVDDLCLLIASPTTQYGLRLLVLEAIHHTAITGVMANPLRRLVLNSSEPFGTRNAALLALIDSRAVNDLTETCESLRAMADDNSTRLVMENAHKIGIDNFSDNQLVETIFAETQISLCTIPRKNHVHVIGVFYMFCKHLPDHRLDDFLDKFSDFADALIDRKAWHDGRETWRKYSDVSGVAIELITRRVKLGGLDATRLWRWLKPYEGGSGYHQRELDAFAKALTDDHTLRRGVQQHVLLETPGTSDVWQRHGTLIQCSSAFAVSLDDALFLLGTLDEAERADDRWREIVQLVRHEGGNGAEVREAARRFTEGRPDLRKWLDSLAISRTPDWQIKQERKRLAENTKLERQWLEHRDHFLRNRGALRAGVGSYAVPPAQAYLGLFDDVGRDRPANERIAEWLGTDLQADAFEGFERFLTASPPDLTAEAVAKSHANNLHYPKAAILVAAIAERLRNNVGTGNIPDNQLVTALLEIKNQYLDQRPGIECLSDAIEDEVRRRTGTWEMFQRLRVEPSLANNCASNPGLVDLMREQRDTALAEHLAVEWLTKHPNMHVEHEGEMIDRLVRSGQFDQLRVLSTSRRTSADPSRERLWNAIALLTDFEVASTRLQGIGATDPDFLWTLQERFFGDRSSYRHGYSSAAVSPQLMAWIVREFREGYPPCGLPSDGWHGSNNPWDAADFIAALIKRLGNDTRREAVQELASLGSNGGDGYTELILASSAEQRAKRADQDYRPPTLAEIKAVLTLGPPASVKDLQTIMLEEIDSVQDKIHSDNIDSWRNFFTDDDRPQPEERCRDALIGLLRQGCDGVELTPEDHLADDKEADIGCRAGGLFLPIEVNRLLQKSIAARLWR